jgi:hypothetical protein
MSRRRMSVSLRHDVEKRLTNGVVDAYIGWREACAYVAQTYADWCGADADNWTWRYFVYMTALDREGAAALRYQEFLDRLPRFLADGPLIEAPDAAGNSGHV